MTFPIDAYPKEDGDFGGSAPEIDRSSDRFFMREAIRQAFVAFEAGEVPVGAVVVHQDRIIGRAYNQTELLKDPTAHAEMIAITQAASSVGDWRLTGCTLYVTKEPCAMCAGAIVLARLDRVVFGAYDLKRGGAVSAFQILGDERLNHRPTVVGGVEEEAARTLLVEFFKQRRAGSVLDDGHCPPDGGHN